MSIVLSLKEKEDSYSTLAAVKISAQYHKDTVKFLGYISPTLLTIQINNL